MPRQLRREYAGAIYHILSRGDRRERIFADDEDRRLFLRTLGEACGKATWQIHAYCLMENHFHLVMETPQPTLVAGMKWFLGTYTQRFNARHKLRGHLFAGRYKSLIVDDSDDFYLRTVCDYVHLNPCRANLLGEGKSLADFLWSSYPEYLKRAGERPAWLRVNRLLGELGIARDDGGGRRMFRDYMERRAAEEAGDADDFKEIRSGWRFGGEDFLERLQELVIGKDSRQNYQAKELEETMEVTGRRIIAEELARRGLTPEQLKPLRKMHTIKGEIARRLRTETTLTMAWIAAELGAGSAGTLANTLHRQKL